MDKALNQLSVPLGQLREEVMVRVVINCKLHIAWLVRATVCVRVFMRVSIAESAFLCERGDSGYRQPASQTGRSAEKKGLVLINFVSMKHLITVCVHCQAYFRITIRILYDSLVDV